jgi:PKD repeat protein
VAGFEVTTSGLTASFTDTSTNTPTDWQWDFGDGTRAGSSDPTPDPTHTYTQPGTYTVRLQASNSGGSGAVTRTVTVTAPGEPPPETATGPPVVVPPTPPANQSLGTTARRPLTLTTTNGRSALRRVLRKRIKRWRVTSLSCRRSATRVVRCTVKARRSERRLSATGTLSLPSGTSTARYRLKVRVTGKRRASTWTGRATLT